MKGPNVLADDRRPKKINIASLCIDDWVQKSFEPICRIASTWDSILFLFNNVFKSVESNQVLKNIVVDWL